MAKAAKAALAVKVAAVGAAALHSFCGIMAQAGKYAIALSWWASPGTEPLVQRAASVGREELGGAAVDG